MNKHLKTGLAALALVAAPLTYNAVMAQQTGSTSVVQQAVDYSKTFIAKLSGVLGVDQAKLEAAMKTAGNATVDEMLKNQDITKTQAEQLRSQVTQGRLGMWERGGMDNRMGRGNDRNGGKPNGQNGMRPNMANISQISLLESAAKALKLTSVELDAKLRAGETLTSLATIQKVTLESVKAAVLANLKSQLDAAVKAKTITQAQADEMLARAAANANFGLFGGRGGGRR